MVQPSSTHLLFDPALPYFNKTWASYLVPRDKNMGIAFTPSCNKSGVEWYGPAQFARQFGLMQMVPLLPLTSLNSELSSRIDLTQSHRSMVDISGRNWQEQLPAFPIGIPFFYTLFGLLGQPERNPRLQVLYNKSPGAKRVGSKGC